MTLAKTRWTITLVALLFSALSFAQVGRNVSEYNLEAGNLGLKGYDPVSYFAEGGSQPAKGDASISIEHKGVVYNFASVENREIFKVMPERYEPTYGGYCAWAMSVRNGSKVDIDPLLYTINGNRAHFFIVPSAKRNFDRGISRFEPRADRNWKRISGKEPRL